MPTYSEGGGPRPPYKESFLENIIGVSWAGAFGAVFVSGDECCFERAIKVEKSDSSPEWVGLGALAFDPGGGTTASTYAKINGKPTFLLGGHRGANGWGIIMISHDGFNWDTSIEFPRNSYGGGDTGVIGLVWDDSSASELSHQAAIGTTPGGVVPGRGLFYATMPAGTGASTGLNERTWYSSDGKKWYFSSTGFASHCKIIPGVPDGVFGYDPRQDLLIFPGASNYYNTDGDSANDLAGLDADQTVVYVTTNASTKGAQTFQMSISGTTDLTVPAGGATTKSVKTEWSMERNITVAFCGGVWLVGGTAQIGDKHDYAAIAASVDGGNDWILSTYGALGGSDDFIPNGFEIWTISGAPIRDFK